MKQAHLLALSAILFLFASLVQAADNRIEALNVARQGNHLLLKIDLKEALPQLPRGFTTTSPARVILDFPNTTNGLGKTSQELNTGDLRTVNIVETDERVRLVLNLGRSMNYTARFEGNALLVTLMLQERNTSADRATAINKSASSNEAEATRPGLRDVNFRRGKEGEGRITIDLSQNDINVDIRPQGGGLQVDFLQAALPEKLRRRLDVTDFATPVTSVSTVAQGKNTRMTIAAKGNWEHNAYQTDNQLIIEIKPVVENPNKLNQGTRLGYQGPRVSVNFQNGDVRSLLRLMAEELKLNAVISDTVTGNITLVLKDVPADQVVDIIFQQRGLDMRKNGNVVLIAPRDEIATREKLEFEQRQQLSELEPLRTESFQINYQKADAVRTLLTDEKQRILSKRGSAVVDARTNILFIQDTAQRLEEARRVIATIDVPVRQVMIEARIVQAEDSFSRNLGVRLGVNTTKMSGGNGVVVGGRLDSAAAVTGQGSDGTSSTALATNNLMVNLPVASSAAGAMSFILYNAARSLFLNAEISALESDGRGKAISNPRVVTADQIEALIEQGVEIPYQQSAGGTGATSIAFRKANLSLKVKPQITPDGKITLTLDVNKDKPSSDVQTNAGIAIETNHIKTEVLVENGGTVVIGGIYTQNTTSNIQKVPLLGDIPVVGNLFKSRENIDKKTELLIFITPRIITEGMNLR